MPGVTRVSRCQGHRLYCLLSAYNEIPLSNILYRFQLLMPLNATITIYEYIRLHRYNTLTGQIHLLLAGVDLLNKPRSK